MKQLYILIFLVLPTIIKPSQKSPTQLEMQKTIRLKESSYLDTVNYCLCSTKTKREFFVRTFINNLEMLSNIDRWVIHNGQCSQSQSWQKFQWEISSQKHNHNEKCFTFEYQGYKVKVGPDMYGYTSILASDDHFSPLSK